WYFVFLFTHCGSGQGDSFLPIVRLHKIMYRPESSPPSVELVEANAMMFLKTLQEWIQRGYEIDLNRVLHFVPGCFAVRLIRSMPN
ncbi:hypothetical protein ACIPLR_26465, partial [Herbaspirillum huttiense]|uniref:hypothetical protein n=1 Tax=Herbaspirillum huttiense TaxID=863372 RepID=UPI0037F2E1ED